MVLEPAHAAAASVPLPPHAGASNTQVSQGVPCCFIFDTELGSCTSRAQQLITHMPLPCTPVCLCHLFTLRTLWIDGNYTGTVSTGSPTQPFKTLVVAWKSLPAAPKMQQAGVTFNIRPVSATLQHMQEYARWRGRLLVLCLYKTASRQC